MMVQNFKCLLFLHLAGTKEYGDFVQKKIKFSLQNGLIVNMCSCWQSDIPDQKTKKSLNMYSKVSIISAGLIVDLTIFPFHSPPGKKSDFCHTLLLNCLIYPASWNHEMITI